MEDVLFPELSREFATLSHRQSVQYGLFQEQLHEQALSLAREFMRHRNAESFASRNREEWSDLSVQVRRLRGSVTIHWRIRSWYKAHEDGTRRANSKHIHKSSKSAEDYRGALARLAKAWEYEEVMEAERRFARIRAISSALLAAEKTMEKMAKEMDSVVPSMTAVTTESPYSIVERIGNLSSLLRAKLWPNARPEDVEAGFVPSISESSGIPTSVNPIEVDAALIAMDSNIHHLSDLLFQIDTNGSK